MVGRWRKHLSIAQKIVLDEGVGEKRLKNARKENNLK
jgi:hypothetical protein